jgi:carboxyl-terminal processing protease
VLQRVLGPSGTDVTLTIRREGVEAPFDVTITRARIVLQNVTWQMLPGTTIAHVRIASYSNNVARDLRDALQEARRQGAQAVILDLRNNPGGLLNEAVDVVGHFLERGNALQVKDADGKIESIPAGRGRTMTDLPMVVLINQGSASASEITAGALQDYGRATIVGETTFGTGTVLNQFRLRDGSAILLATQLWLTPNGRVIWHEGIQPDEEVVLPPEVLPSIPETERDWTAQNLIDTPDTQLKRAIEILQGKLP